MVIINNRREFAFFIQLFEYGIILLHTITLLILTSLMYLFLDIFVHHRDETDNK